jgi:hypothetical protein
MSKIINVLKPFAFSKPLTSITGNGLPEVIHFRVGEQEITDELAAHPWIAPPNNADGHIETEEATEERKKVETKKKAKDDAEAENALAQAQASLSRLERNQEKEEKLSPSEEDLNTPINKLRSKQGAKQSGA